MGVSPPQIPRDFILKTKDGPFAVITAESRGKAPFSKSVQSRDFTKAEKGGTPSVFLFPLKIELGHSSMVIGATRQKMVNLPSVPGFPALRKSRRAMIWLHFPWFLE